MIGRVGTVLGEHGVNIASTAVGREPGSEHGVIGGGTGRHAVMVVTDDTQIPDDVIHAILALDGFQDGRAVTL
jgi:D-3-phosphoglycerate dehydrogenase